ncbi:MAG: LamG domain-containing protein [Kiritimatiellae bacterium]|nr:LamG domain-containing protein [Kiritimatiellia bacterium]
MKIKYFFVFLLTSLFAICSLAESGSGYKYFKASISYDGATIENMPVLLRLSEKNILGFSYSDVVNKSFKIFDKEKNILPYEIDTWSEEGESTIWVKVPNFSNGQILEVRYGLDYTSNVEMESVWENYISVWHLEDVNTEDRASDYDGVGNGNLTVTEDGKIGKAVIFPGTDNSSIYCGATLPNSELKDGFTVEGWIKPDTYSGNRAVFGKKDFISIRTAYSNTIVVTTPGKDDYKLSSLPIPTVNEWWHMAVTFTQNTTSGLKLYINGVLVKSMNTKSINNTTDPTDMWIGGNQWSQIFSGHIDEVRLMNSVASADYLAAEYAVMADANTITYGTVGVGGMGLSEIKSSPSLKWNGSAFEFSCEIYTGLGRMFAIYENTATGVAFTNELEFSSVSSATPVVVNDYPVFEDEGNYTCSILSVIEEYSTNVVVPSEDYIYAGTPVIEKLSDVSESNFAPGIIRFSRSEAATDKDLVFSVALSGPAIEAGIVENNLTTVTIPAGSSYVDVEIMPIWAPDITEDLSFELNFSGSNFAETGDLSIEINVINANGDILVRYVSTTGSDENDGLTKETPFLTVGTALNALVNTKELGFSKVYVEEGLYAITNPITISTPTTVLGLGDDSSNVVISNTFHAYHLDGNHRIFTVENKDAIVANLTMAGGSVWGGGYYGGGFRINEQGGTVSNCVVVGCRTTASQCFNAGAYVLGGLVTHTVFRDCVSTAYDSAQHHEFRSGVLATANSARVENCLFENNNQTRAVYLLRADGNSIIRNCTIVNSSLSKTNNYCTSFAAIYAGSNSTIQNVVVAGVTNTIDGAFALPVVKSPARFINGATDADITDAGYPEGTIVGTAKQFFINYEKGNFRPNSAGPLAGAGQNYDGMAAFDLSGKQDRLIGLNIDIGCYEASAAGTILILN